MNNNDLLLNSDYMPAISEAGGYIGGAAEELWHEFNQYIQNSYKIAPKAAYSSCSGQPGWNYKYQKAGKALCTLYPEKSRFIVLVVVTLTFIESLNEAGYADPCIREIIDEAKPFNKTKWLMIPVADRPGLESVIELIHLKQSFNKPPAARK